MHLGEQRGMVEVDDESDYCGDESEVGVKA